MKNKGLIALSGLLFLLCSAFANDDQWQLAKETLNERGEVYFTFSLSVNEPVIEQLDRLTRIISLDAFENLQVKAYANRKEFNSFLKMGYKYKVLTPPSMERIPQMRNAAQARSRTEWDFYPTYSAYLDIMDQFVADYPDLCELVTIGTLNSGRKLLAIHINDSLGVDQAEPEFLYTSSMHGDELTGYVLSLHLIEYLLENYGEDDQVTNLVENIDIWINPLANPNGTYAGGNNTVYGATRGNANGVDLNRNYPDFQDGPHPDGNEWQEETVAFMDFAEDHDFVMSSNFHDGTEVCNYPWDTWSIRHADDDWWYYVCRQWADTVHAYSPSGYFTDLDNGVTNGYDWYSINGGRQDYMNHYHHCREFTLEISDVKIPPESQLPDFWDYQHRSMLNYMEQVLFGVRGEITNANNGNAVPAKVWVEEHDKDESQVYAFLPMGNYHRPIKEGTYDFTFSSFGYYDKTITNVSPEDMSTLILDVELQPYVSLTADFSASDTIVKQSDTVNFTDLSLGNNIVSWDWLFEGGVPSSSSAQNPEGIVYNEKGYFDVSLTIEDNEGSTSTITIEDFILVTDAFKMKDTLVYLCDGLFYDSGGPESNYSDNEDHTITFVSLYESGMLEVVFFEFESEENEDCSNDYIEAYDGLDVNAPLIGKWCGDEYPNSVTAHNVDGAITFRFRSDGFMNFPGWKAFVTCDTSVGIQDMESIFLSVYPNPANQFVTIEATEPVQMISIYDLSGKKHFSEMTGEMRTVVSTTMLEKGIYILQMKVRDQVITKKLLVQ